MAPLLTLLRKAKPAIIPVLIAFGIILRMVMFLHNRNLIIDEANIVRNLAERGFGGLAKPLSYEQYAPPVFLWIEKLASLLFGFGEKAMRLYPLLCGIGTLVVFPAVAGKLMRREGVWLPMAYLAGGFIFLKYSAEVKQYMPDTFIALLLLWLALCRDVHLTPKWRFALLWMVAGSVAIWSSMPSVFILAGVGGYYAWQIFQSKRYGHMLSLSLIVVVWLLQFALYYTVILEAQINSSYLQSYHHDYFLNIAPANFDEWKHNWERLEDIIGNVGGWSGVAVVSNLLLAAIGAIHLIAKRKAGVMLTALPVMLVLIAAALHQFSLIDRVVLFMMPLWLLLIGVGFQALWRLRTAVKAVLLVIAGYDALACTAFRSITRPYEFHEITHGMAWIRARHGTGNQLYVHDANVPTYIYYTELHPQKAQWKSLLGAHRLRWDDNYAEVTKAVKDTAYFLYTGGFSDDERKNRISEIEQHMRLVDYYRYAVCFVYVYVPNALPSASGTAPN